jgi:hypothetical protein
MEAHALELNYFRGLVATSIRSPPPGLTKHIIAIHGRGPRPA